MEALTVLEGEGVAWMEGREPFRDCAGHDAGVSGEHAALVSRAGTRPLKTYGVHASPHRIVIEHEDDGKSSLVARSFDLRARDRTTSAHLSISARRNLS